MSQQFKLVRGNYTSHIIFCESAKDAWESFRSTMTRSTEEYTLFQKFGTRVRRVGSKGIEKEHVSYWEPRVHGPINLPFDLFTDESGYRAWDCSVSPDGKCHYYTNHLGLVSLYTGEDVQPPPEHNHKDESDDWCIFCGEPEERK